MWPSFGFARCPKCKCWLNEHNASLTHKPLEHAKLETWSCWKNVIRWKKQTRPTGLNGSTNLCSGKLKANWPRGLGKNIRLFCRKQHMARMVMVMMMMMMMTTATLMIRRVRNGKGHLPPPTATSSFEHQCMHRLLIRIARNCFSFKNLPKVLKSEVHPALPWPRFLSLSVGCGSSQSNYSLSSMTHAIYASTGIYSPHAICFYHCTPSCRGGVHWRRWSWEIVRSFPDLETRSSSTQWNISQTTNTYKTATCRCRLLKLNFNAPRRGHRCLPPIW